jgi:UDP-N-acetyl-D-mannosaminuronic acid dehydrogenase
VNIAFANELVKICNKFNINALEVIALANKHPRVNILKPGPGVGGHCIAVDPYFVASKFPQLAELILTARKINCDMPLYIVSKVKQLVAGIQSPKIAIFGIAYKGNIGDIRESPALDIIRLLKIDGFVVEIYDPYVNQEVMELTSLEKTVENADMILILTDHNEFKEIDYYKIVIKMRTPLIFDTRNIIDLKKYNRDQIAILNLGNVFDE